MPESSWLESQFISHGDTEKILSLCLRGHVAKKSGGESMVTVTDGDGQSIRGVRGGGRHRKAQKEPDHRLHLSLLSAAVSDNGAFYLQGRVFEHGNTVLGRSEKHDSPHVSQFERGLHVGGMKHLFDRHGLHPVAIENPV